MYLDRLKLTGRAALITGGARGIGLACADALCEAGAHVCIADRDEAELAQARKTLAAKDYTVATAALDVTRSDQATQVIDDWAALAGRIDILVNNAGIARSEIAAEDMEDERWLDV
ncbi:MAG TPA: SDR family NAD(P)-dependent oxidoreductase, partial [Caulobacteraceae bacterium]|nr:SDR family NAD(P)-dependent oxidoreductase [Caulobacteraceae bacterium]